MADPDVAPMSYKWADVEAHKGPNNLELELADVNVSPAHLRHRGSRGGGTGPVRHLSVEYDMDSLNESGADRIYDQYVMSDKNKQAAAEATRVAASVPKLGTLMGVFLPCVQNIMGVIIFIRLPYITGQAGVLLTTLIVLVAKLTTTLTTLSMSAIATNGQVQDGGPYYIISRNLGVEIGGAIGTLFSLALTLGASLYVLGAVETLMTGFGDATYSGNYNGLAQFLSLLIMGLLTVVVRVGVRLVNMSANMFLLLSTSSIFFIVIGLVLFATDAYSGNDLTEADRSFGANFLPNYTVNPDPPGNTPTFFSLLALFFPSSSGIMAGCNRSAVLSSPSRSIPKGTLGAIVTMTTIYLCFIWLFGNIFSHEILIDDKLIAARVAWPTQYLVSLGIVFSSIGAGMQCLVGASRLVAAIANDHTIPFLQPFAPKMDEEPNRALYLVCVLASLPCLAGNLDYITPIMTMFFLLMYASVNLSCFVLSILQSPGFRPRWKYYHWSTALAGFTMCITLMLVISWRVAISSTILALALLFSIKYQNATRDWGDTLVGFRFQLARDMLLSLSYKEVHPKNWRPQLLVFCKIDKSGNPTVPDLVALAGQMKMGRGLLMCVGLLDGDIVEDARRAAEAQRVLGMHLSDENIEGFCKVSISQDVTESAVTVMHHAGIGSLQPNTVLFAWPEDWSKNKDKGSRFVSMLRGAVSARKAVMVLKGAKELPTSVNPTESNETIDIWWVAHDGGLLLLVPYLLKLHPVWKRCSLRLFSVIVNPNDKPSQVERDVREYLDQVRIEASVRAIDMSDVQFNKEFYQEHVGARARQEMLSNMGVRAVTLDTVSGFHDLPPGMGEELEELEDEAPSTKNRKRFPSGGAPSPSGNGGRNGGDSGAGAPGGGERGQKELDKHRLMTAVLLNKNIGEYSARARLVVTNLPLVRDMHPSEVLQYVEAVGDGIAPLVMIRGTGVEVVTQYG